jgi:hypothetical protein
MEGGEVQGVGVGSIARVEPLRGVELRELSKEKREGGRKEVQD